MAVEFDPMRSLIYVNCDNEKYRVHMEHWLQTKHMQDSIAQFEPYVTKYAYYKALPVPADGERFGVFNYQMTEHYWLFNPESPEFAVKAFGERVDAGSLKACGILPDDDRLTDQTVAAMINDADALRNNTLGAPQISSPFIFVYLPVSWQEDYKGAMRTIDQGPNYRWQMLLNFPDGVSEEEADKWFREEMIPVFQNAPEVRRILSSKVRKDVNNTPYDRAVEMWFGNEEEWAKVVAEATKTVKKPSWATTDVFPYLQPKSQIASIMLSDYASSNNMHNFGGPFLMR